MPPRKTKKTCAVCGVPIQGVGKVCGGCAALSSADPTGARRVAQKVRDRLSGETPRGQFICPYCKEELSWEHLGTSETEVTIYVREKIFFCPKCRCFLGVSSWHTEG
jgi:hypothetical protein